MKRSYCFSILAVLVLAGCFLDNLAKREPYFDPRIPIEPGAAIPDSIVGRLGDAERDKYRCIGGRIMWCEAFGNVMECRCTL